MLWRLFQTSILRNRNSFYFAYFICLCHNYRLVLLRRMQYPFSYRKPRDCYLSNHIHCIHLFRCCYVPEACVEFIRFTKFPNGNSKSNLLMAIAEKDFLITIFVVYLTQLYFYNRRRRLALCLQNIPILLSKNYLYAVK